MALAIGSLAAVSLIAANSALAQGKPATVRRRGAVDIFKNVNAADLGAKLGPVITGTVTAINGPIISVRSKLSFIPGRADPLVEAATYTVDAGNATVRRIGRPALNSPVAGSIPSTATAPAGDANAVSSLRPLLANIFQTIAVSDIRAGDLLVVRGAVNGANVVATDITASSVLGGVNNETRAYIAGTVRSASGSTLAVAVNSDAPSQVPVVYTVDASAAIVRKLVLPTVPISPAAGRTEDGAGSDQKTPPPSTETTVAVADIVVGDMVGIEGTVSGKNVIAMEITDGLKVAAAPAIISDQHPENLNYGQDASKPAVETKLKSLKTFLLERIASFFKQLFAKRKQP